MDGCQQEFVRLHKLPFWTGATASGTRLLFETGDLFLQFAHQSMQIFLLLGWGRRLILGRFGLGCSREHRRERFEHGFGPRRNRWKYRWHAMSLADLFFKLLLVIKKRFERLIKVFFDKILHQLVIHSNETDEKRDRQGIELWRVEFEDNLGQDLSRDIRGGFGVNHP